MRTEPHLLLQPSLTPNKSRTVSWFKSSLTSSLFALLDASRPAEKTAALEERMDELRDAMLELMAGLWDIRSTQAAHRLRVATDLQSLWFLRTNLMAVLAVKYGETAAREKLDALTTRFEHLLPKQLRSRTTGLNRR